MRNWLTRIDQRNAIGARTSKNWPNRRNLPELPEVGSQLISAVSVKACSVDPFRENKENSSAAAYRLNENGGQAVRHSKSPRQAVGRHPPHLRFPLVRELSFRARGWDNAYIELSRHAGLGPPPSRKS
jgi:hypothetical protein